MMRSLFYFNAVSSRFRIIITHTLFLVSACCSQVQKNMKTMYCKTLRFTSSKVNKALRINGIPFKAHVFFLSKLFTMKNYKKM